MSISKSISSLFYKKGDSWFHFQRTFVIQSKARGFGTVFGFIPEGAGDGEPLITPVVHKWHEMDLTLKHNAYIMEHPSLPNDLHPQFPIVVNVLTGPEQLEFTAWHKRKEAWREKCASAYLLLQNSLHPNIWMDIEINCGDISDIENKRTISKIWKYLEEMFRTPTFFQVERNSDMIDAIPTFDRWQDAEHHMSTFHSLCQER